MAYYKPDYKLLEAQKIITELDDNEVNNLIKYYIKDKEDYIKKQNKKLDEYQDFFNRFKKLTNG